jgi:hypothetical protein
MLPVFQKDVLSCPRRGGRLSIIATVTSPSAVRLTLAGAGPGNACTVGTAPAAKRRQVLV